MPIISNTGPLLSFARARHFDLLGDIVEALMIPTAVYDEIVVQGAGLPGAIEVPAAEWITRADVRNLAFMEQLPQALHSGEREAMALAKEMSGTLLIDDQSARRVAEHYGIACMGCVRVLEEGKQRGTIPAVKPVLDSLIAAGMYTSNALYRAFLHRLGEAN
jgi:predicted nucleic acid-binding protein